MTNTVLTETMAVPPPEPEREPVAGPADWVRRNLFSSVGNTILTVVSVPVVAFVVYRLARFAFDTGRWDIVRVNLRLFVVGRYPADQLWRIAVAVAAIAGFLGLVAGFAANRRRLAAPPDAVRPPMWRGPLGVVARLWPLLAGVVLLLVLTSTIGPWLTALGTLGAGVAGRVVGAQLPRRSTLPLVVLGVGGFVTLVWFLSRPLTWEGWGGMMLNLFLAIAGITLCFPLGVLLALGRRSKLPLIHWLSIGYIELFRGVPLYVLLLLSYYALGLFWPAGSQNPGLITRSIVALTLFTAAYVAEIVRGGLQSLPRGQTEASMALGMSPVRTTAFIVLPQALRNVIPALVGQFISLFKDTTLAAAAMGLLDLYNASDAATSQPAFQGQNLTAESLAFVMLLFWIGCITMSRESQRLERRLGVGVR